MFKDKNIMIKKVVPIEIRNLAIEDYLTGMSYRMVAEKYSVDHKTVRRWAIKSGKKIRTREEAYILESIRIKGVRRSPNSEFKKGNYSWNTGTKGVMKANSKSFKPGEHVSPSTEFKKGQIPWNNGIPCSEETKIKIGIANKGKLIREAHWNWQGGPKDYTIEFNIYLKEYIRYRDSYKCFICQKSETEYGRALDCHHIDYDKKNCKEDNLISLCKSCHMKTNFNRNYWKNYFKEESWHLKYC